MVKECMSILTNMTEAQSIILSRNLNISDEALIRNAANQKIEEVCAVNDIVKDEKINTESVVNIDGILLSLHDKNNVQEGKLVPVKSTINNLRSLALGVASG